MRHSIFDVNTVTKSKDTYESINMSCICILIVLLYFAAKVTTKQGQSFFGSGALFDKYCDEAEHFINAFTLSSERLEVNGSASDITHALNVTTNKTGK